MAFEWNSTWSVGVESCDRDHRKLFCLIEDLHEAMRVGKGKEVIELVVDDLLTYTKEHFANEEKLLGRAQYPALAAHRIEHQQFTNQVAAIRRDLSEGHISHTVTVSSLLSDWLQNHIRKSDRAYSAHLLAQGVR